MNRAKTPAALAQRRANVQAIAERRRDKTECKRGHNEWYTAPGDGRRRCRICRDDRGYYRSRGFGFLS